MLRRLVLATLLLAPACEPITHGYNGPDGGDAGEGPAATDEGGDGAVAPPAFKSDPPGADVVDEMPGAAQGVVLVSARFTQEPSGTSTFQQLWGELRNVGKETHCYLRLDLRLTDALGTAIASFQGFAEAYPFADESGSSSIPCLAPGAGAGIYLNDFTATAPPSTPPSRVWVTFTPDKRSVVPDPAAPLLESTKIETVAGGQRLVGTVRARALINNVAVSVYPMVGGIPAGRLRATSLEELDTNSIWAFETDTSKRSFTEYMVFTSYLRGPLPVGMWISPAASAYEQFVKARDSRAAEHARRLAR